MNLLKTLAAISSMTMLSRVTGLLRESLFARAFGAGAYTDAFIVAFRIPNLLRRLFAEGAFSQAFVPILSEYKNQHGQEASKQLADHVATTLVWATLLVSLLGIVGAPWFVYAIATGLTKDAGAFDAAVWMTRLMFPYITCMSFVALAGGILNTWREFKIPAFTPVLLNLSFIAASLFLAPHLKQPIYAMAIAVFAGGLLQVAIQIPALIRIGMLPRLSLNPAIGLSDGGVRRVLKKMGPAVFAVSAAQISLMINTSIASRLTEGSISWLSYADRLMEFPTAMLGVALGTILLPSLSKANVDGDKTEYSALLDWGLRLTFLLALPAAVGMATLATPLIATLFHYGKFTAESVGHVHRTAGGLQPGPDRHHPRENPGARVLCAPGHPHARENRHRRADRHAADESAVRALHRRGRPGPVDRPGRLPERHFSLLGLAQARHLPAETGLGQVSSCACCRHSS